MSVIGISAYLDPAQWGSWHRPAALLPQSYVDGAVAGGAVPVLLPVQPPGGASAAVRVLDGLVLSGGADVDPALYGESAGPRTVSQPDRDSWELALLRAALDRGLPVLAICRGMQLLNVALDGTLHQHLPDVVNGADGTTHQPAPAVFGTNTVRTAPGSLAAKLLGDGCTGSCHHHQSVSQLGSGLVATAWAEDGTIEAIEHPAHPFLLGVQWHPEEDPTEARLFTALTQAATAH